MEHGWCRPDGSGAVVSVRVVPGASRASVVGVFEEVLRVRVCSPPVDGRANDELCSVIAGWLGLRPRQVQVVAGLTSRSKQVRVELSVDGVRHRLER